MSGVDKGHFTVNSEDQFKALLCYCISLTAKSSDKVIAEVFEDLNNRNERYSIIVTNLIDKADDLFKFSMNLKSNEKEALGVAIVLLRDFLRQSPEDDWIKSALFCINLAKKLNVKKEYDKALLDIPPLKMDFKHGK